MAERQIFHRLHSCHHYSKGNTALQGVQSAVGHFCPAGLSATNAGKFKQPAGPDSSLSGTKRDMSDDILKAHPGRKKVFMMSAFDRIIGYASVKRELQQISDILKTREAYSWLGVSAPKGAAALW